MFLVLALNLPHQARGHGQGEEASGELKKNQPKSTAARRKDDQEQESGQICTSRLK